jgi:hypothetical protein
MVLQILQEWKGTSVNTCPSVTLGVMAMTIYILLYEIGRSPQVVRCAPKLGLEGCRLRPKVLLTCHDGTGLQNVLRRLVFLLKSNSRAWCPASPGGPLYPFIPQGAPCLFFLNCLKCVKLMGKHFIDPKKEWNSIKFFKFFKRFSMLRRTFPFLAETAPCPFEILAETLGVWPLSPGAGGDCSVRYGVRSMRSPILLRFRCFIWPKPSARHASN